LIFEFDFHSLGIQLLKNIFSFHHSKLIAYQIDDTRRKNQFAEEAANEQAIRDDKLLEAIRNIGGLGKNGKGPAAANDSSGGGFLSSLLGSLAGSAGVSAISKLVPLLSGAMAALPWARILRLATPVGAATLLSGSTPDKQTQQKQNKFYEDRAIKQAQERAAEEAKNEPRPLDGSKGNYRNNQRIWDEKYKGRKDPVTGKTIPGIYNIPVSGKVSSTTGTREAKTPGMSKNHQGVDIAAVLGSPVNSIAPGTVIEVDKEGGDRKSVV
jgi:murein DD-endopeptidase MepM/ murein hydrolase activator NlpD